MRRLLGVLLLVVVGAGSAGAGPTEEEKIEKVVAAVVEAYRTGDFAALSQHYAPDVTMVPGDYTPLVSGWTEVEGRYRQAYAALGQVELIRENTRIFRRGHFAWAAYQWRFAARLGNENIAALGHTTLILEKRQGRWVIVHNHSSALVPPPAPAAKPAAPPSP